ncbi:MAG: histidine phosphatase family protein [Desulfobacterales bacterium]|nr:histidine phosphatase family protein [Desulfobacterales bacterium]
MPIHVFSALSNLNLNMITTVYIIRHGLTINAEEKRYSGHLDVPLSEEGEKQIGRLADHLVHEANESQLPGSAGNALGCIYCSDLQRSRRSAEIIARSFGLQPIIIPRLRERGFGRWEGMTFDEINRKYPDEFMAWINNPLTFFPVGGESTEAVRDRVMPAFRDIIEKEKGKKTAIVAHGGVNRIIICELLGVSLQNMFRIEQDYSALNVFSFHGEFAVLRRMNFVAAGSRGHVSHQMK